MFVKITVEKWEDYNPRKDGRVYSWFRMQTGFFSDQKIFGLSHSDIVVLLFLYCEIGKKTLKDNESPGSVELKIEYIAANLNLDFDLVKKAIISLDESGLIRSSLCERKKDEEQVQLQPVTPVVHSVTCVVQPVTPVVHNVPLRNDTVRNVTKRNETNTGVTPGGKEFSSATPPNTPTKDPPVDSGIPNQEVKNAKRHTEKNAGTQAKTNELWRAYSEEYRNVYGADPVRNAVMNAVASQLIDRLGNLAAVEVTRFFVRNKKSYYAQRMHDLKVCLHDAEALHTQWKNGRVVTGSEARSGELSMHNKQVVKEFIEEIEKGG